MEIKNSIYIHQQLPAILIPAAYSSNTPYVYGFFNGNLSLLAANSDSAGIRPALALKSTAKISGGNGTASNPYVISGV